MCMFLLEGYTSQYKIMDNMTRLTLSYPDMILEGT